MTRTARIAARIVLPLLALVSGLAVAQGEADAPSLPHEFEPGEVIRAEEMNENFRAVLDIALEAGSAAPAGGILEVEAVRYTEPREHFLSVPAAAFRPSYLPSAIFSIMDGRACFQEGDGTLVAPVHLPDGAVITDVTFSVLDLDASGDLRLDLKAYGTGRGPNWIDIADAATTGEPGYVAETYGPTDHEVDDENYSYYLSASSSAWSCDLEVQQVTISYLLREAP